MKLLPMDYALLKHLVEFEGSVPTISIPSKIFAGEIPAGAINLVDAGLIEHVGGITAITGAGRGALALQKIGHGPLLTATAFQAIAREALTEENETANDYVSDNGQFGMGA